MPKKWIMKNPIRIALHGDEDKARTFIGEGKRILFQVHSMLDTYNRKAGTLYRKFADGTLVRATSLFSNDTIFIESPPIPVFVKKEIPVEVIGKPVEEYMKEMEIEKELLITAGFVQNESKMFCHIWPLSLNKKTEIIFNAASDSGSYTHMSISDKRAEAWIGDEYDRIHCINLLTKKHEATININSSNSFGIIFAMAIDDRNGHLYVGSEDSSYIPTIFQIDLDERKIINRIIPSNFSLQSFIAVSEATINDKKVPYLFAGGSNPGYNSVITKYKLPGLTYESTITIPIYASFTTNCTASNNKDGYLYIPTEDCYVAGGIPWYLIRVDAKTDTKLLYESSNYFYRVGDVDETTGNVYYLGQHGFFPDTNIYAFKFDKNLSLLTMSSAISPSDWFGGAGVQKNGNYFFGVLYGYHEGGVNIFKFNTSDMSIKKSVNGGRYYTAAGIYYGK